MSKEEKAEICLNCKWWCTEQKMLNWGDCRKNAPVKTNLPAGNGWPVTQEYQWCGEFEVMKDKPQENR